MNLPGGEAGYDDGGVIGSSTAPCSSTEGKRRFVLSGVFRTKEQSSHHRPTSPLIERLDGQYIHAGPSPATDPPLNEKRRPRRSADIKPCDPQTYRFMTPIELR